MSLKVIISLLKNKSYYCSTKGEGGGKVKQLQYFFSNYNPKQDYHQTISTEGFVHVSKNKNHTKIKIFSQSSNYILLLKNNNLI